MAGFLELSINDIIRIGEGSRDTTWQCQNLDDERILFNCVNEFLKPDNIICSIIITVILLQVMDATLHLLSKTSNGKILHIVSQTMHSIVLGEQSTLLKKARIFLFLSNRFLFKVMLGLRGFDMDSCGVEQPSRHWDNCHYMIHYKI